MSPQDGRPILSRRRHIFIFFYFTDEHSPQDYLFFLASVRFLSNGLVWLSYQARIVVTLLTPVVLHVCLYDSCCSLQQLHSHLAAASNISCKCWVSVVYVLILQAAIHSLAKCWQGTASLQVVRVCFRDVNGPRSVFGFHPLSSNIDSSQRSGLCNSDARSLAVDRVASRPANNRLHTTLRPSLLNYRGYNHVE